MPPETKPVAQAALPRTEPEVPKDVLDRAVDAKLREVLPLLTDEITRQVAAAMVAAGAGGGGGDVTSVVGLLANQLGELTRQNDGTPYVSPEEQNKRRAARAELIAYLEELSGKVAANEAEMPIYELTAQIQDSDLGLIDDEIMDDRKRVKQRIGALRIPNEAMQPVNETARRVHQLFMESIGGISSIGGAHHKGPLQDGKGRLFFQKTRSGSQGGVDTSAPILPVMKLDGNPALGTIAAVNANLTVLGNRSEGSIERVAILGTVQEPAKMQRL